FEMRRRGFEQTPQGLPSEKKDPLNINSRSIFGSENNSTLETAKVINHKDNEPLGIQLDSSVQHIAQTLRKISTVKLVSSLPDILVKRQNSKTLFVGYSGDIMHSLYRPKDSEIIQILRRYARLHYLKQKNYSQEFNVELHTSSPDSGGIVVEGEKVGFSIRTDTPSYILLVNFDPSGIATVIYPDNRSELKKIKANDEMLLKNVSRARAPFGTDYILLYAFDELTHEHELLMGKQFPIDSPLMNKLEHLVRNKNVKKAMADLELITVPKSN
ncbi:MAG: DUF4384 domain-containing protein, partial [Gammaproteobacteria bacterium]|nr:DUF4384 domain-containing protein [Gammaproteobacteria bacterium]